MENSADDTQGNLIFLVLGIMLGILLSIAQRFLFDTPEQTKSQSQTDDNSDWEDEAESDEDASNANAEQSPEKDKALFAQFPIDDVK